MSEFYIYLIKCLFKNGSIFYYTGITNDPQRRFKEHSSGKGATFTRGLELLGMRTVMKVSCLKLAVNIERWIKKNWTHQNKEEMFIHSEKYEVKI